MNLGNTQKYKRINARITPHFSIKDVSYESNQK
jgi:hypothetical protein